VTSGGLEHPPLPGWLAVPVINNDGLVVGLLQLSDKVEGEYTIDDVEALELYAQIVCAVFDVQFRKDEIVQKNMEITSLDRLAHQDYLTGEHNRLSFDKKLSEVLAKPLRKNDKVTLFLLDLDSFKSVNDTMGHTVGDELLKEVSKRVKSHIRDDDFLARLGGDEFAIIFLNINERVDAIRLADKLIAAFENNFQLKNHEIACSISIGIADSENIRSPSELLQNVDMALQRVKKSGKNKALYYEKYLDEKQKRALKI
jgi:diguanylate cyclase (GGDEF)-like protein